MRKKFTIMVLSGLLISKNGFTGECEPFESAFCFVIYGYGTFLLSLPGVVLNSILIIAEYLKGWISTRKIAFLLVIFTSFFVNVSLWLFFIASTSKNYTTYLMNYGLDYLPYVELGFYFIISMALPAWIAIRKYSNKRI